MTEDHKLLKFTSRGKLLTTVALCGTLLLSNGPANAAPSTSSETPKTMEQMQALTVNGLVVDSNGEPIIGANVLEKGTTNGSLTDVDGKFTLNVRQGAVLQISFIGYKTQEVKATSNMMRVVLAEDNEMLDEVVVVGYGSQKKVNVTGAVSTVDVNKALEAKPQMDVTKALQGVVPGLTILNTQGGINEQPSMTIRGVGTLSNSETSDPLIIVDGVPLDDLSLINPQDIASVSVLKDAASTSIYGSRAAFGVVLITTKQGTKKDKFTINYSNNFAWSTPSILPEYADVPSQLRALIEVNERNATPPELFGMYMDEMLPYAEAWQEQHGHKKAGYREMQPYQSMDNVGDYYLDPTTGKAMFYADWDVVGIMYQNWAPSQSHNVNVQGTSGKTTYYLSVGYDKKEGQLNFNTDKLKRYNVNANISSDVTDWLQIGGRFSFTDRTYTEPNTRRTPYQYMWRWGSFFEPLGTINGTDLRNTIMYLKQAGDTETSTNYVRMTGFAKAKLAKGLTVNADYTYNVKNLFQDMVGLPVSGYDTWGNMSAPTTITSSTYLQQQSERTTSYAFNLYANYEFTLADKHNFNIMLGGNAEGQEYTWHRSKREGLLNPDQPEFNLANGTQTVAGRHIHSATAGYFGRINYNWNEIWLLELNGRLDGSSSFPTSDRWAFFPSGSLGYRFSQENYFENLRNIVSNGKLRASFGEIGNEAIGEDMFISTINALSGQHWLGSDGTFVNMYDTPSLVSSTLTWERIRTFDVGLDLGFMNNELNVSFDWYQRKTLDMLAPGVTLPDMLGTTAPYTNAGSLRTRGWELNVSWNKQFGDFTVYANGNLSDYKTVVTNWNNPTGILSDYFTGKVYGDIYGFETDRYFTKDDFTYDAEGNRTGYAQGIADQDGLVSGGTFAYGPGDIKYKDLNGDGVIDGGNGTKDDMGDLKVIGNSTPRFQYGFRLGGSWKGIDLDMYFQGVGKWDQWSYGAFVMPFSRGADGIYANQMDYWTEENTDAFYPRLYPGNGATGTVSGIAAGKNNFYPQSKYLIDRSYLRFKNLTVGYTLPQAWTKKCFMQKARIYFTAENLCELINNSYAPVDPEIDSSDTGSNSNGVWGRVAPITRTISFGLQVTF